MVTIDASSIPPEVLLYNLYVNSKVQGLGKIHYLLESPPSNLDDFKNQIDNSRNKYIDYMNGKVIKVNFSNMSAIDSYLYDRDNSMFVNGKNVSKLEKIVTHQLRSVNLSYCINDKFI